MHCARQRQSFGHIHSRALRLEKTQLPALCAPLLPLRLTFNTGFHSIIACIYQTEGQVCDLQAAHTAVQEETRAEIKRVQSEASKAVSYLQSLLSFKVRIMDTVGLRAHVRVCFSWLFTIRECACARRRCLPQSVALRLARMPPLQAGCVCARPSRAYFGHTQNSKSCPYTATLCRTLFTTLRLLPLLCAVARADGS